MTMKDLMSKFYETNKLSDVICEECYKVSSTEQRSNFESKQSIVSAPMQPIISLQITGDNMETERFCKNKTKIALSAQYSLYRPNEPEVIYVLVSIKYHIGNDMDQGHYICNILDYSTGTWWKYDDEIITKYPGYPMNVYNEFSSDKKHKKVKDMIWMDQKVLFP